MIRNCFIFFLLLQLFASAQTQNTLTASYILDRSIDFCGGEKRIASIKTTNFNYVLIQPDESFVVINEKRKVGKKYVQSVLSRDGTPQTTFLDEKKFIVVVGDTVIRYDNEGSFDEMMLKTYDKIQYGYKALKYKLTRMPDEKYNDMDCYVLEARASSGYTTVNYFDKTNFRLVMVVYPGGNRSAMIKYKFKDSVLFNTEIWQTFKGSDQRQTLVLQHIELNLDISDLWFTCPYKNKVQVPSHIRTGNFVSTTGNKITFTRVENSQDYQNEEGKIVGKRLLKWNNSDTFVLMDDKPKGKETPPDPDIFVRIVSWNKKEYVCHWLAGQFMDTQDYKIKK